ncbi:transposase [Prolixibacter denitrificans]|jgi:transposase-like protein|uniref:Transposase n=1 Tax=Prolixibacter denitrificans TaxID=1541063 RepID=A0A2P8C543_9BACT|nr:transposase [Prolixibacter denitrificans]PSK80093.1 transposase [Prolixibacter denitrificans]GET22370.1 hypothetical protein JCM18694_26160 [Prolixibacter denitrificans]GET22753.1 hypothetical protein JCM18694_29990 [Prolixibacter denitrificans]GET22770.1 hypothetical protein JCM18694_30160 [Prolixibacter denitrificans]
MKVELKKIQRRRHFSDDFKRSVVRDYEKGYATVSELGREYGIQRAVVYRWIYKYSNYNKKSSVIVEMKESSTKKIKELEAKIKELERIVGTKQINIDYLEKMIEIAKTELDIDIKKNFSTPQSNGSGKTKKK